MDRFARRSVPALLAVLVVVAPQAGGAVFRWSAVAVAAIVVVMTGLALGRASVRENARVDIVCTALTGIAAWTAFQLVPLPPTVVRAIAPAVYDLYSDAAALPLAAPMGFIPLTIDRSLTAMEAAKWASYAALYVIILNWPRGGGHQLTKILLVAALVTAAVCLVESLFRVPGILGIYQPQVSVSSWLRGPFVNPGHSGIYCALLGTLCLGIAAESSPRLRLWIRLLGGLLFALALTSQALKTTLAVITGPAVYFLLRARAADRPLTRGRPVLVGLGVLVAVAVVIVWWLPTADEIRAMPDRYVAYRRYSRIITWSDALRLIRDVPLTGVGRGSFGAAFTAYDTVNTEALTWHAENVPIQMAAEWGIAPTLAFLVTLGVGTFRATRGARRAVPTAAAAALVMLAIVNLVDFDVELFGIGLTAVLCLGMLSRKETPSVRVRRGLTAMVVPGALTIVGLLALLTAGRSSPESDVRHIGDVTHDGAARDAIDRAGSIAAGRHPADFFIPQFVASEHLRLQTALPLVWLNRALRLRPSGPEAHYLVGMTLQRAGKPKQALLEYVSGARLANKLVRPVAEAILRNPAMRRAALDDLAWARPLDATLLGYLAIALSSAGSPDEGFRVDERLLQLAPTPGEALGAIHRQKQWVDRNPDLMKRMDAAILVSDQEVSEPFLTAAAEIRGKTGRVSEAADLFSRAAIVAINSRPAVTSMVNLMLAHGHAKDALRRVDDLSQRDRLSVGDAEFLRAMIQDHLGNAQGALFSYIKAAQYHPDDIEALVAAALAAQRASREDLARQYARRALDGARGDASVRERLAPIVGP